MECTRDMEERRTNQGTVWIPQNMYAMFHIAAISMFLSIKLASNVNRGFVGSPETRPHLYKYHQYVPCTDTLLHDRNISQRAQ